MRAAVHPYRDLIAQNPIKAARELRSMMQTIRDEDEVRSEVIPFIVSMLPHVFAAKAVSGEKLVRAIRNYNSQNNPNANERNIDAVINGIPAIIRVGGWQNGVHVAAAMMDGTIEKVQHRVARRFLAKAPSLSKAFPHTTQDMLGVVVDQLTGGPHYNVLSKAFARVNASIHGRPDGQTWFIPARDQQGNICDVLVLGETHRDSIKSIRPGRPFWKSGKLIHAMLRGDAEPAEVAKAISTRRRSFKVLDL